MIKKIEHGFILPSIYFFRKGAELKKFPIFQAYIYTKLYILIINKTLFKILFFIKYVQKISQYFLIFRIWFKWNLIYDVINYIYDLFHSIYLLFQSSYQFDVKEKAFFSDITVSIFSIKSL